VLLFENANLYNLEGELADDAGPVDLDTARIVRPGTDVSLVTYGGSLHKTLDAAKTLAERGIDAEVVDLRTLRPLDEKTLLQSVAKTRRAVVVDEGWKTGSFSGEVITRIIEGCFYELDAPPSRVCSVEVPMPYAKAQEQAALPQPEAIVATAERLVHGHV